MKHSMKLFLVIALVAIQSNLLAQQTWKWDYYGIALDLPDDFEVVKNTNNEFEAEGAGMGLYIYIFEEDISIDEMDDATIEAATQMELEEIDDVEAFETRSFEGFYVAGYKDGAAILFAGVIDPESTTNFFVAISFGDDDEVAEDDAFDILDSIRKY